MHEPKQGEVCSDSCSQRSLAPGACALREGLRTLSRVTDHPQPPAPPPFSTLARPSSPPLSSLLQLHKLSPNSTPYCAGSGHSENGYVESWEAPKDRKNGTPSCTPVHPTLAISERLVPQGRRTKFQPVRPVSYRVTILRPQRLYRHSRCGNRIAALDSAPRTSTVKLYAYKLYCNHGEP